MYKKQAYSAELQLVTMNYFSCNHDFDTIKLYLS